MIFIKKLLKNEEVQKTELFYAETGVGDKISHSIDMKLPNGKAVRLFSSTLEGIDTAIKNSLKRISEHTSDNTFVLSDDINEISLYIKGQKITMEYIKDQIVPIEIKTVPENTTDKKKFSKDIIVFVCDKINHTKIVVDKRNLISQPVIVDVEDYFIILVMVKWPNWADLKFPVYMYIEQNGEINGAFRLGSKLTDKGNKRNQLIACDVNEAKENIAESLKKQEENKSRMKYKEDDSSDEYRERKQKHNWERTNPRDNSGVRDDSSQQVREKRFKQKPNMRQNNRNFTKRSSDQRFYK